MVLLDRISERISSRKKEELPLDPNSIEGKVAQRINFHAERSKALFFPTRARDKLTCYAELDLKIVKARDILAGDLHGTSDPYVQIFVDDVEKARTQTILLTTDPIWNYSKVLPIKNPGSVVQLQICDYDFPDDDDLLGFVEFPIAILPPGDVIRGWFCITPQKRLTGSAPDRVARELNRTAKETCGSIYLEMELRIVAGDVSDEFYAWCLPQPTFHDFPDGGLRKSHEHLDGQAFVDALMGLKRNLLNLYLHPLLGILLYILQWNDIPLTLLVLTAWCLVGFYPDKAMSVFLGLFGLILCSLYSEGRRAAVVAHPSTVPLNDEGYKAVAKFQNSDKTYAFLTRVITNMHGKVLDSDRAREFAAFATEGKAPVCSYASLKKQLLRAADREQSWVTFKKKPYDAGALIQWCGEDGEVVKCLNPGDEPGGWRYLILLDKTKAEAENKAATDDDENGGLAQHIVEHGVVRRGAVVNMVTGAAKLADKTVNAATDLTKKSVNMVIGDNLETPEVHGDELEARVDVRWMRNDVVLALIPDSVETMVQGLLPTVRSASDGAKVGAEKLEDILSWRSPAKTFAIVMGLLGLSFLLYFFPTFQACLAMLITTLVFLSCTSTFSLYMRFRKAKSQTEKNARKGVACWPFFTPVATPMGPSLGAQASPVQTFVEKANPLDWSCCLSRHGYDTSKLDPRQRKKPPSSP
jgi:hypothetical protein